MTLAPHDPVADGTLPVIDVDTLYATHGSRALAAAYRITRDRELSADAVQEAFLAVWRAQADYSAVRGTASAWLLTIVHHRAVDQVRRAANTNRLITRLNRQPRADRPADAEDATATVDRTLLVHDALNRLPPAERQPLLLAYFGGQTQAEIATTLNIPIGTIKARMSRAMPKLRRLL